MDFEQNSLSQQVSNLIQLVTVVAVDTETATIQVLLRDDTQLWVPWIASRAGSVRHWSAPVIGEQLLLLCPAGDTEQAIAIPALYQDDFPAPGDDPNQHLTIYSDGARIGYNDKTHHLYAQLPEEGTTELISRGGITITGDITVNGSLQATGDIADGKSTLQANRDVFNNHTHPGDSGGTTGSPNQQQ